MGWKCPVGVKGLKDYNAQSKTGQNWFVYHDIETSPCFSKKKKKLFFSKKISTHPICFVNNFYGCLFSPFSLLQTATKTALQSPMGTRGVGSKLETFTVAFLKAAATPPWHNH